MARIRSIKPEFPQSESMGRVSRDARLLFVMLWPICDDHGRTRGASRMLASLLFPYDADAPRLMDKWLDELEREGCIRRYVVDGSTYLEVCNWLKHQRIDKPSKPAFPSFDESSSKAREDSRGFVAGKEGNGGEGNGGDLSEASLPLASDDAPADPPEPKKKKADNLGPVCQVIVDAYHARLPKCTPVSTMLPKRRTRLYDVNDAAKLLIERKGLGITLAEFWDGYFAECQADPWLRGDKPNSNNPSWRQNIDVLLSQDRFASIMDAALARDLEATA